MLFSINNTMNVYFHIADKPFEYKFYENKYQFFFLFTLKEILFEELQTNSVFCINDIANVILDI